MSGNPLRDLDGAARIHVLGDTRRTEAVTTNCFSIPLVLVSFKVSRQILCKLTLSFWRRPQHLDSFPKRRASSILDLG
jgi:hypothetical protein